ncbi:MAG: lipoyl(octanoyl) transferase LipB [Hellea sp.]|jgi:lipoyl(octanoyl) transferase
MGNNNLKNINDAVEWVRSHNIIPYEDAVVYMENQARLIANHSKKEKVWLLEHPSLYSAGTSANKTDLIDPDKFPVFHSGRGGQYTYHGPGQRVAYVMLDLRKRGRDVSAFVRNLEQWIINTLLVFDIKTERRSGRVGVWAVQENGTEEKIAAIGVRLKKWISFHGISINLNPDLSHFEGIVPCGIQEFGVTSLHRLGKKITMDELDDSLKSNFEIIFGPTTSSKNFI